MTAGGDCERRPVGRKEGDGGEEKKAGDDYGQMTSDIKISCGDRTAALAPTGVSAAFGKRGWKGELHGGG